MKRLPEGHGDGCRKVEIVMVRKKEKKKSKTINKNIIYYNKLYVVVVVVVGECNAFRVLFTNDEYVSPTSESGEGRRRKRLGIAGGE